MLISVCMERYASTCYDLSAFQKRENIGSLGMHRGKEETICLHFSKANLRVNNDNETYENTRK